MTTEHAGRRPVPPVPRLKDQAARLRARAHARGEEMSASQALEALARLMGAPDWNTLRASAVKGPEGAPLEAEEKVWARYMGSDPVRAKVLRVALGEKPGLWRVQIQFLESREGKNLSPVHLSRERVQADVDGAGVSVGRLSSGIPHLALELR
ncbi:glyoxalase superfamily protein [Rhodovulum sp. DZ06]|uniref:glyoxalase superfamily protein n=1 Tax=Rhodovulum sp. DZ06 TaxID=3425126 RepID=UPI003D3500A3